MQELVMQSTTVLEHLHAGCTKHDEDELFMLSPK